MWKFIVDVVHDFVSSLQPDVGRGFLHVSNVFLFFMFLLQKELSLFSALGIRYGTTQHNTTLPKALQWVGENLDLALKSHKGHSLSSPHGRTKWRVCWEYLEENWPCNNETPLYRYYLTSKGLYTAMHGEFCDKFTILWYVYTVINFTSLWYEYELLLQFKPTLLYDEMFLSKYKNTFVFYHVSTLWWHW